MATEAQKRALAAFRDRRKSEGRAQMAFWLSEEARERLAKLTKVYGSRDLAVEAGLLALASPPKPTRAAEPVLAPEVAPAPSKAVQARSVGAGDRKAVGFDPLTNEPVFEPTFRPNPKGAKK